MRGIKLLTVKCHNTLDYTTCLQISTYPLYPISSLSATLQANESVV